MAVLLLVASPANAESTVFINVNVIPMTSEEVLSARTVIVTNGKITAIGDVENTPLPDNAVVIDGTDRFLMADSSGFCNCMSRTALPLYGACSGRHLILKCELQ
jgi:hypothetical protein